MRYEILVVLLLMDVETIPQVATDDYASKTQVAHLTDIVKIDAAHRIDMLVDKTFPAGLAQLLLADCLLVLGIALTVEDGLQENIIGFLLGIMQFGNTVAGAAEMAFVAIGQFCIGCIEVDSLKTKFLT